MSEKLRNNSGEQLRVPESAELHEKLQNKTEKAAEHSKNSAEVIDRIRAAVEQESKASEKTHEKTEKIQAHQPRVTRELKNIRYQETMRYVRRHLTPSERKLSSFIHNPGVEKVSEVGAKTVARPSGILGGGIVAFSGSVLTIYFAKTYGFEVPNSVFMALFVIGFIVGVFAELLIASMTHKKRRRQQARHSS